MADPWPGTTTRTETVIALIVAVMMVGWLVAYAAVWLRALITPDGLDDPGTEISERPKSRVCSSRRCVF
jgi:hypothetical protein